MSIAASSFAAAGILLCWQIYTYLRTAEWPHATILDAINYAGISPLVFADTGWPGLDQIVLQYIFPEWAGWLPVLIGVLASFAAHLYDADTPPQ